MTSDKMWPERPPTPPTNTNKPIDSELDEFERLYLGGEVLSEYGKANARAQIKALIDKTVATRLLEIVGSDEDNRPGFWNHDERVLGRNQLRASLRQAIHNNPTIEKGEE